MSTFKTLAIRLDSELHARLTILAKLTGVSISDAIRTAIETEVERMASSPDVASRATELQDTIAREAEEQRAAIQALFGSADAVPAKPASARKGTSH